MQSFWYPAGFSGGGFLPSGFNIAAINGGDSTFLDYTDATTQSLSGSALISITSKTNTNYVYSDGGTSTRRPTMTTFGSVPCADFDGSSDFLVGNAATLAFMNGKTGALCCSVYAKDDYTSTAYLNTFSGGATSGGVSEGKFNTQITGDHHRLFYKRTTETQVGIRGTNVGDRTFFYSTADTATAKAWVIDVRWVDFTNGTVNLMKNGFQTWTQATASTGSTLAEDSTSAQIGALNGGNLFNGKLAYQFFYSTTGTPPSKTDARNISVYFAQKLRAYTGIQHLITNLIILFGDSIIAGSTLAGLREYPQFQIPKAMGFHPFIHCLNNGVGSTGASDINESLMSSQTNKETLATAPPWVTKKAMLTATGTNTLAGGATAAATKALLDTHLSEANAVGISGLVKFYNNVIARASVSDTLIDDYNALVTTADGWDYVANLQSDTRFDAVGDTSDLTYYDAGGVHPTATGEAILSVIRAADLITAGFDVAA